MARVTLCATLVALGLWYALFLIGGPSLVLNHDELNYLTEALRLPAQGRLGGYVHGPFLYELLAVAELGVYAVLRVLGRVGSPAEFLVHFLDNLGAHLALGRAVTALFTLGLVLQIYRYGRLLAGTAAGALAAVLCALNLTIFAFGSMCKEDVIYTFLLVTAMLEIWRASEQQRLLPACLAGACVGAAFATKYFGALGGILAVVPLVRAPPGGRRPAIRIGLAMAASSVASAFLFCPFMLTDTTIFFGTIRTVGAGFVNSTQSGITAYLGHHLPNVLGWGALAFATCEVGLRARDMRRDPVILLLAPLTQLAFLASRRGHSMPYYILPVAAAFCALAAAFVVRLWRHVRPPRLRLAVVVTAVAVMLLDPAFVPGTVKHAVLMFAADTRLLARDYLHAHVPQGGCVAITGALSGENVYGPPLTPMTRPPGSGVFATAARAQAERAPGPKYDVRLATIYRFTPALTEGCEWLVVRRFGEPTSVETAPVEKLEVPPGFKQVAQFRGLPETHSAFLNYYTTRDYDELRHTSLAQLWREGARGMNFEIYRR